MTIEMGPMAGPKTKMETLREELTEALEETSRFRLCLANIRKIHSTSTFNSNYCAVCFEPYPCATIRAAEGKNE